METGLKIFRLLFIFVSGLFFCIAARGQEPEDTLARPSIYVYDTALVRLQFIRDSLLTRQKFIEDSLLKKKHVLDSLLFLQTELPGLLDAYLKTVKEDIILRNSGIRIKGDSALDDYNYEVLPFSLNQPYLPWKVRFRLVAPTMKYLVDQKIQKITSIQAPFMQCSFFYAKEGNLLIINEMGTIQSNASGRFYLQPVDSIFYDRNQRVIKVKRYQHVYAALANNQRGTFLFVNPSQVKQFEYDSDARLIRYQLVSFCDRWKSYENTRVCSITNYTIREQQGSCLLTRRNDPANNYSDGTYTYLFDQQGNLTGLSFQNLANTESWERTIEMNNDGNVSCYIFKKGDVILQSQCYIYHPGGSGAKYPVETVTTSFEKDGISYFQRNNTTGQSRTRDRMTLEWSSWK